MESFKQAWLRDKPKGNCAGGGHRGLQKGQEKFAMRYSNYFHLFLLSHLGLSAKRTWKNKGTENSGHLHIPYCTWAGDSHFLPRARGSCPWASDGWKRAAHRGEQIRLYLTAQRFNVRKGQMIKVGETDR